LPAARPISRRALAAAPAEDERADRYPFRRFREARVARVLLRGDGEARVRMRRGSVTRLVRLAEPVDRGLALVLLFPPRLVVRGQGDVREDRVVGDHLERVTVRLAIRSRHDAEIAGLGIDRAQTSVLAEMEPRDVVAERPDFPALVALRSEEHTSQLQSRENLVGR